MFGIGTMVWIRLRLAWGTAKDNIYIDWVIAVSYCGCSDSREG
jgi:hypothetical protein